MYVRLSMKLNEFCTILAILTSLGEGKVVWNVRPPRKTRSKTYYLKPHPSTLSKDSTFFQIVPNLTHDEYSANFHSPAYELQGFERSLLRKEHPHWELMEGSDDTDSGRSDVFPSQASGRKSDLYFTPPNQQMELRSGPITDSNVVDGGLCVSHTSSTSYQQPSSSSHSEVHSEKKSPVQIISIKRKSDCDASDSEPRKERK